MNSSEYQNAHEKNLLQSYFMHNGNSLVIPNFFYLWRVCQNEPFLVVESGLQGFYLEFFT